MLTWLAPLKAIRLNDFTTNEKNILNTLTFKVVGFDFCFLRHYWIFVAVLGGYKI